MIEITTTRHEYNGNGATVTFPIDFRYDAKSHVKVYVGEVLKTLDTDYTLTVAGVDSGGTLTFITAPAAGTGNVVILRISPKTQLEQLPTAGPFPTTTVEINMIDKLCMMVQELQEEIARCVKFPIASLFRDIDLPTPEAGKMLQWNSDADGLQNVLASSLELTHTIVTQAIAAAATSATITHNLSSASAKLIGFAPTWHTSFSIISQTANTIVVEFGVECPPVGGTLITEVAL